MPPPPSARMIAFVWSLAQSPAAALLLLLCWVGPAGAEGVELARWVGGVVDFYNERSELQLPVLGTKQLAELSQGEVVQLIRRVPRPGDTATPPQTDDRLLAYRVIPHPMADVWLAALDPDLPVAPIYHDARLWSDDQGNSRWTVLLDLPWPLSDRYWTVDLSKSPQLAIESGGRLWEHRWELTPDGPTVALEAVRSGKVPGVDESLLAAAIYTPVNRGGLLVADIGEHGTLVIYHLSTVVGGFIPDALVDAIGKREMRAFLEQIAQRSASIREHYVEGHAPVYGGDGKAVR